jgi:hypothetical protein
VFKIIKDKKYRILCTIIAISGLVLLLSAVACRVIISNGWADVNNDLSEFIFSTFVVLTYMAFFAMMLSLQSMVVLFAIRKWRGLK